MKEMVSWRGVAKKRRKQETGRAVNQMFAYCCGHATIVARRQPLFEFIGTRPATRLDFDRPRSRHNLGAIAISISSTRESPCVIATRLNLGTARGSPGIEQRDSHAICSA